MFYNIQMLKYCISILLNLCLFTVLFAMPVAVALSQWIGVGGCEYPSYRNVSLMILDYFLFRNSAPSSASASDATINLSIWHSVNITPLRCMGCLSCGLRPRKKCSAARILAYIADK